MSAHRRGARRGAAAIALLTALGPTHAAGQQDDALSISLGGYARILAGGRDLGFDPGAALDTIDRRSAFLAQVVRLKWGLESGPLRISVHNRLTGLATTGSQLAGVLGLGVSATPGRSVDLSSTLVSERHLTVEHDIDRLSASIYLDAVDLTVGRQAITWGISNLFPVADLWAQFSPFELDTEEKPGVDAARALFYPAGTVEVDLVVADRGAARDLSAGGRATITLPAGDLYVGGGKFWREATALAGASFVAGSWKIRSEVAVPYGLDQERFLDPRATVGVDRIGTDVTVSAEVHFNGLGTADAEAYAAALVSPEVARGQTYYLGRWLAGVAASWLATDRLSVALAGLANVTDPSAALLPSLQYDLGQRMRLAAGGLVSFGPRPAIPADGLPGLRSEFGTYGHYLYGQAAIYF